jgi:hypothetical protein
MSCDLPTKCPQTKVERERPTVHISARLPARQARALHEYSQLHDRPVAQIVREALRAFIRTHKYDVPSLIGDGALEP